MFATTSAKASKRENKKIVHLNISEKEKERERERESEEQGSQVQKMKKAKFGHKQFQKGQIIKNEKRPHKD